MKLLIGADIVPTDSNKELFIAGNVEELIGEELLNIFLNADYKIFNLEVPLTDIETPISKCGPNLIAPTSTIAGIKNMGIDFLTLANNHILDQDEQGMISTMKILDDNKISYAGVGKNLTEASKPYILEKDGKKIGIYCCTEHEFSIATNNTAGANPFDPLESLDHIKNLKSKTDYVIVLYHGGKEHYRYPSPYLQKVCRKVIEKGADLVVCQHTHCIGCEEKYLHGTIVYGQGNFLFDHSESEFWQTSLLISIDEEYDVSYTPVVKCDNIVRLADKGKSDEILSQFKKRSAEIKEEGFINEQYKAFANIMLTNYLFKLSGKKRTFIFKVINKLTGNRYSQFYIKRRYSLESLLVIQNYIECEAHKELIINALINAKSQIKEL